MHETNNDAFGGRMVARVKQGGRASAGYFRCLWDLLTGRSHNLFF